MKKIIIISASIILLIISIFAYKYLKNGNNMSNKTANEIAEYILNISSFEANCEVTINGNKTNNKYIIKQKYIKDENIYKQEIIEPTNIQGLSICYDGKNLTINDKTSNLSKTYNNYKQISNNNLYLTTFIQDYRNSQESNLIEEENTIIMETKVRNGNKHSAYKTLYIEKNTGLPVKLEVKDMSQNVQIYILYNEVKINNLQKEDVLAFKTQTIKRDI